MVEWQVVGHVLSWLMQRVVRIHNIGHYLWPSDFGVPVRRHPREKISIATGENDQWVHLRIYIGPNFNHL